MKKEHEKVLVWNCQVKNHLIDYAKKNPSNNSIGCPFSLPLPLQTMISKF
jgi:hypothetical protein